MEGCPIFGAALLIVRVELDQELIAVNQALGFSGQPRCDDAAFATIGRELVARVRKPDSVR
jgi:hypothetical protein